MSKRLFLDILKTMQFGKSCICLVNVSFQQAPLIPHSKLITDMGGLSAEWAAEEIFLLFGKLPKVLQSEQVLKMTTEPAIVNMINHRNLSKKSPWLMTSPDVIHRV